MSQAMVIDLYTLLAAIVTTFTKENALKETPIESQY